MSNDLFLLRGQEALIQVIHIYPVFLTLILIFLYDLFLFLIWFTYILMPVMR